MFQASLDLSFFDEPVVSDDELTKQFNLTSESEESIEWTEDEVYYLKLYLLKSSLKAFEDGRACMKARTDALKWMNSTSKHPFSFHSCCIAANTDPDETRDMVIAFLNRDRRSKGLSSIDSFMQSIPE